MTDQTKSLIRQAFHLILALIVFALPGLALAQQADSAVVFTLDATNVEEGDAQAIQVLLAMAYENESGIATKRAALDSADAAVQRSKAQELGASSYITASVLKLGSKFVLAATLHDAAGVQVHRAEMTATSMDDMQVVTRRIAAALVERVSTADTLTSGNVAKIEGRRPNRTFTEKLVGAKVEFMVPVAKGERYDPTMSLSFNGRFESQSYFLEFGFGFMLPTTARQGPGVRSFGGLISEVGASYYLLDGDISPYVGAGITPRIIFSDEGSGVKLGIYGQFGAMFFRQSSTRLYTDLRVSQNVVPFNYGGSDKAFPTDIIFDVGIGF